MLTQTDRRLETFETQIWRRMEKISWVDKLTNEEVLRRVIEDRQILNSTEEGNINGLAIF